MAWRTWGRATGLAGVLALGAFAAAQACSPVVGYVRPSNFELVQIAEAIVVATPVGEDPVGDEPFERKIRLRVSQILKGEVGDEIEVNGMSLGPTPRSDPADIIFSHPEGHMGPCNRVTLAKGSAYILFLDRNGETYRTLGYPFSRVSEDYAGESGLWTRTIKTYLRLQNAEAPMAQLAALEAMRRDILAKTKPTRDERALAADIELHLGALSPWKPTAFLLEAYDNVKNGRPPRYRPRASTFDAERSSAAAFTDLLMSGSGLAATSPAAPPRRDPRLTALLEMMIEGEHPMAMPLFDALAAPAAPSSDLAMAIRFYAKNGRYREAYGLIEDRAAPIVATAAEDDAWRLLDAFEEAQQDSQYHEGPRRWRREADVAKRWPQLAFSLTRTANARFDRTPSFDDSLSSLLGTDYRRNPELTLLRSGADNAIIEWAILELAKPETLAASSGAVVGTAADPLRLPLEITMRWFRNDDDRPESIAQAFCRSTAHRHLIFDLWGRPVHLVERPRHIETSRFSSPHPG